MACDCVPGVRRCAEADAMWESANAIYRSRGYDAWLKALEPYNAHVEREHSAPNGG